MSAEHPQPSARLIGGKLAPPVRESPADRWIFGLIAVALLGGFFYATHVYWSPAHGGTDQNGYVVGGKLFARTLSTGFRPGDPFAFVGRMWIEGPDGRFFPKYPLGLSAIYAMAFKIGGAKLGLMLVYLVNPLAMTAALAATFLLARLAAGSFAGVLAVLIFGTSSATWALTDNPNSHATAVCCSAWGIYLLLRWWQRDGLWRAIGAGLLLGMGMTIRYTEGLLVLPLAAVALLNLRLRWRRSWIESVVLGLAWLLPIAILLIYNEVSFHHLTGYDPTNESTGFTWKSVTENYEVLIRQLYDMGLFFVLPLAVMGMVMLWRWSWRLALVLTLWVVPNLCVYAAYYWAPNGTSVAYLRFFLTIFPALTVAAVWMLWRIVRMAAVAEGATAAPLIAVGAIVAVGTGISISNGASDLESLSRTNVQLYAAGQSVLNTCPSGSAIFGRDQFMNYLQQAGDYQLYDTQQFTRSYVQSLAHVNPDAPTGLQPQRASEMYQRLKRDSDADLIREQNTLMSAALAEHRRVFILAPRTAMYQATRLLGGDRFTSRIVGSWTDPPDARPPQRRPWLGFNPQPWWNAGSQRNTIWEIVEVFPAPPRRAARPHKAVSAQAHKAVSAQAHKAVSARAKESVAPVRARSASAATRPSHTVTVSAVKIPSPTPTASPESRPSRVPAVSPTTHPTGAAAPPRSPSR